MEASWTSLAVILLLTLQCEVAGSHPCQAPERKCDFVCDCSDCTDEQSCGYRGEAFKCDFEEEGICGWRDESLNAAYTWERRQRGRALQDSGPASDFTIGTATGWFLGVTAVRTDSLNTAVLISPVMKQSSPTCRLRLRYFTWDSGHTGLGSTPLWASLLHQDSREAVVWRPEVISVRGWREATIFLGRIPTTFQIRLSSRRSAGQRGDVSVDHLEFLDCALPSPLPGDTCPEGMLACKRGGCVEQRQVCDNTDDCGDRTDEEDCAGIRICDFEEGLCDWDLRSLSKLKWVRTSQDNISTTEPLKGPGRDHSNNSISGHFLYVTAPDGPMTNDWASFQSPLLELTNSLQPCKMVMYTHQFGPRSGGLTVLVADKAIYPVWQRGGALGDVWVKAEVEINTDSPFHIVVMAAVRDFTYGGIAIDSIVLSAGCNVSSAKVPIPTFPKPPKNPCTEPSKLCDFNPDCKDAEDEAKCGDFSYAGGSSGWTDSSIGGQGWMLQRNASVKDEFLYVSQAPGQQLTEAQTRTPLLGPSGPVCTLSFDFGLIGADEHIGELSVRVVDSRLGVGPKLWEFSGRTGTEEADWRRADVPLAARKHRFQLEFEARAVKLSSSSKIKVTNVRFVSCHAEDRPSSPTGLSCNFEDGLCDWYQDNSDNFDWTEVSGMDHTIRIGRSLVVDMWSPSLRGAFGRLLSFLQPPNANDQCLSFFYKLYGPNAGVLNVKLLAGLAFESVLLTRSGAHGNMWHEAHCTVPQQHTPFQLMFEAVRSGFDGQLAIDDVALVPKACTVPRLCSFEEQSCGYTSSGSTRWLHLSGRVAGAEAPRTDHTLETELGYYMMLITDVNILPSGAVTTLTSPVGQRDKTECAHFWYHMGGGENPGSLTVYVKPLKGDRVMIFSDNLSQGDVWHHGNGNIPSNLGDWQLEFEVVGAGGRKTHVAVDDIVLLPASCEGQGSKCSLESGMCSWSNTQNLEVDKLDWEVTSPEAETHYTIPDQDHTLGSEQGHFLFFPSSSRTPANENARLLSPHLPPTKGTCLTFWAHKPVSADSELKVWRSSKGHVHELLQVGEVSATWKRFNVNIRSTEEYQIVFEGIKGTWGSLALDDLQYTVGIDCNGKLTDLQTKPKPDDAGGIAASVIVVLLVIGTIIALLVCYLRKQEQARGSSSSSGADGFNNEVYDSDLTRDLVNVTQMQNHPMAAGFNNILTSGSSEVRGTEEA